MPSLDGKKLVSETYVRNNRQARIVFTIEVQAGSEAWARKPNWENQAIALLRDSNVIRALQSALQHEAVRVLVSNDFSVLETGIEVAK